MARDAQEPVAPPETARTPVEPSRTPVESSRASADHSGRAAAERPAPPPEKKAGRGAKSKTADTGAPAGVRHILQRGQTLYSLARLYDVPVKTLMSANHISNPRSIRVGTPIFVPGARELRDYHGRSPEPGNRGDHDGDATSPRAPMNEAGVASLPPGNDESDEDEVDHEGPEDDGRAPERRADNALSWPLHGRITGPYGRRGKQGHHAGIDIDGQSGDPIQAAASGVVVEAGVDGPYGRRVVIDHGDGWTTLYAHAERLLVHEGETVHVGQRIALVGRSGNARGTHLHFEVRHDGRCVNPTGYLSSGKPLSAGVQ